MYIMNVQCAKVLNQNYWLKQTVSADSISTDNYSSENCQIYQSVFFFSLFGLQLQRLENAPMFQQLKELPFIFYLTSINQQMIGIQSFGANSYYCACVTCCLSFSWLSAIPSTIETNKHKLLLLHELDELFHACEVQTLSLDINRSLTWYQLFVIIGNLKLNNIKLLYVYFLRDRSAVDVPAYTYNVIFTCFWRHR